MSESWRGILLEKDVYKKQDIREDFSTAGRRKIKDIKRTRGDRSKAKQCD